jgi:hypothetical protein
LQSILMTVRVLVNACDVASTLYEIEILPRETVSSLAGRLAIDLRHPPSFSLADSRTPHSYLDPDSVISDLCLGEDDFLFATPLDPPPRDPEDERREMIDVARARALTHRPAAFCPSQRCWVSALINGIAVLLLPDSGACYSVMSLAVARECNMLALIDKRFPRSIEGVGAAMTVGDLWDVELNVGGFVSRVSFRVLEDADAILGSDWLLGNRAAMDFDALVLHVGGFQVQLVLR